MNNKFVIARKVDKDQVLLIDFSNMSMRNLFIMPYDPLDEHFDAWKSMMIRSLRKLFREFEAGRIVFCLEGHNNWRKKVYPEYKANRIAAREESKIDFQKFFAEQDKFLEELKKILCNCYFVQIEGSEADDLIAVITKKFPKWRITNISSDRDFYQLYKYPNYKQYDSVKGKYIEVINPKEYLLEKVIVGDAGDNIPKIKEGIGTKRAEKILHSKEGLEEWLKLEDKEKEFQRNLTLIDFDFIPEEVQSNIFKVVNEYKLEKFNPRGLMDFLTKNKLFGFIPEIGTFATMFKRFDVCVE